MSEKVLSDRDDIERIRSAVSMPDLVGRDLGELTRISGNYQAPCPFHSEKTPSFTIYPDHAHCFGCGWHGDIFRYWQSVHDCDFPTAKKALAELGGIYLDGMNDLPPRPKLQKKYKIVEGARRKTGEPLGKAPHPPLRELRTPEIMQLARIRGLNALAVRTAANDFRRVGACDWPQYQSDHTGRWSPVRDAVPSWVATDSRRHVVQYRRLDGKDYESGRTIKAWTGKGGSATWPIGAADIGDKWRVLLVEGGADMLAAYHFLWGFRLLDDVAVVCLLGCKQRIAQDALQYFKGKRVRIMIDADPAKPGKSAEQKDPLDEPFKPNGDAVIPKGWSVPSIEGAKTWQAQLTKAGAAVETFSLYGLKKADGGRVEDLNDLALADAETLNREDVGDAFFAWDF